MVKRSRRQTVCVVQTLPGSKILNNVDSIILKAVCTSFGCHIIEIALSDTIKYFQVWRKQGKLKISRNDIQQGQTIVGANQYILIVQLTDAVDDFIDGDVIEIENIHQGINPVLTV